MGRRVALLVLACVSLASGPAAAAPPEVTRFDEAAPFATVIEDCGTEPVAVVATIRLWGRSQIHAGAFRLQLHSRMEGSGVGVTSLGAYKVIGHELNDLVFAPPDLSAHIVLEQKLVGSGTLPNATFYVRVRVIIRDGVPVVQHERAGCRITG